MSAGDISYGLINDQYQMQSSSHTTFLVMTSKTLQLNMDSNPNFIMKNKNRDLVLIDIDEQKENFVENLIHSSNNRILATCNNFDYKHKEILKGFNLISQPNVPLSENLSICSKAKQIFVHLSYELKQSNMKYHC